MEHGAASRAVVFTGIRISGGSVRVCVSLISIS